MPFVEYFLLRLLLWGGLLFALVALAIGPRKLRSSFKRMWSIVFRKRLDPEEILTNVVLQHEHDSNSPLLGMSRILGSLGAHIHEPFICHLRLGFAFGPISCGNFTR